MAASRMGLRKELKPRQDPRIRSDGAQVRVTWSREPEMEAWMLEHDTGGMEETIDAFEERFGIRLSRGQVNQFRARAGTQRKRPHGCGRPRRPVGFERECKGGILVKVAPEATVPMSKDNWRFKHVIAYEEAYGEVPEGHVVMAVDGDNRNCDPANLVAVDRRLMGAINQARGEGLSWHDRDSMLACVAIAALKVASADALGSAARPCAVCGRPFEMTDAQRRAGARVRTCPACLAAGLRARGERHARSGPAVRECAVCGSEFAPQVPAQRRCPECIAAAPHCSVAAQRRRMGLD